MSGFKVQVTAESMEDLYAELAESRPLLFGDVELNRAARSVLQAGLDWLGHDKSKEKLLQLEHRLDILSRQVGQRVAGGQFSLDFPGSAEDDQGDDTTPPPGKKAAEPAGEEQGDDAGDGKTTSVEAGDLADEVWMNKFRREILTAFTSADPDAEGVRISDSGSIVTEAGTVLNPGIIEVEPWVESLDIFCLLLFAQDDAEQFHAGSLLAVRGVGVVASRQVEFKDIGGYKTADEACKAEAKTIYADLRHLVDEKQLDPNAKKVFAAWKKELFPEPVKKRVKKKGADTEGSDEEEK